MPPIVRPPLPRLAMPTTLGWVMRMFAPPALPRHARRARCGAPAALAGLLGLAGWAAAGAAWAQAVQAPADAASAMAAPATSAAPAPHVAPAKGAPALPPASAPAIPSAAKAHTAEAAGAAATPAPAAPDALDGPAAPPAPAAGASAPDAAPAGPASAAPDTRRPAAAQAGASQPAFDIRVDCEDEALRALVARHTDLRRYREVDDLEAAELARLMVLAERNVRNLLGAEGYFNPAVSIRREQGQARPLVVIAITPGPLARVRKAVIDFEGDLATTQAPDALAQRQAIEQGWGLPAGRRFSQQAWASAKTEALRLLVQRRYPRGRISYSLADVDAVQSQADLTLRLDSGPAFRLGQPQVKGARRYPPELAAHLSWLKPGDVYDQKALVDAQQRLAGSGYYDSAYISIDLDAPDPAAAAVIYNVTEASRHKVQLGLGYSTDGGPRLSLEHRDNTVLGTTWRLDSKLHLDSKAPLLQGELASLPDAQGWRWAALGRYMRQDDGTLNTTSQTLRAGRMQATERYDRHFYLQYDHANVTGSGTSAVPDALLGDGAALSANFAWTGRYFDSLPTPASGYGLSAEIGAGITTAGARKPFVRLNGRALAIVPLAQGRSRLALRGELGAVLASDSARLPSTYLFRTGGDTTVRGYGYRRIGIDVGNNLVGPGRYMTAGSIEWQRPILRERFGSLLEHTLFIDAGSVANRAGQLRAHWGIGTGLRLNTPVGPMEVDLAYGLKTRELRLHMTVGFTF